MTAAGHFAHGMVMFRDLQNLVRGFGQRVLPAPAVTPLHDREWAALRANAPFVDRLSPAESQALRERVSEFLGRKTFKGIRMQLNPWQRHLIAAYACLPVLRLGIDAYRDWQTVIVYPDTFAPEQEWVDEAGVHHQAVVPHAGEAWERGPVILSWNDIADDGAVIVHEVTHTLDAGNGDVNGFPPLPRTLPAAEWTDTFSAAYEQLQQEIDRGDEPVIDPYAATDPAEFLAVLAEYFFFSPAYLQAEWPAIYRLLGLYFRLEPHRWADEIPTRIPRTGD
jgi:MtfA peptidase